MAGEWAIVVAAVGGAGVSSLVPGYWAFKQDQARRADEAERVRLDRLHADDIARAARDMASADAYENLCIRVARAAGVIHGVTRVGLPNSDHHAALEEALLELGLHHGEAANYARDWFQDLRNSIPTRSVHQWAEEFTTAVRVDLRRFHGD